MIKKIVIIGTGQLGSRHLQGIAQSSFDISIEVIEPFEASRETAKQRYEQIENNEHVKNINFYDSIEKLSDNIDLAIVATSADVRCKVISELLETKNVKNLVLEKVLFQTVVEYYIVEKLLENTKTECWVNHPRRMFPYYKELKVKLKDAQQVSYSFQSGDWGLGCNSLHFIDHLSYLVDSTNLSLTNEFLDNTIYDSKRKGFVEFNGLLAGKVGEHNFSLYSNKDQIASTMTISSDILIVKIDEANGDITIATKDNNWKEEVFNEKIIYFQSELSNILIEDILINKKCFLPTYKESMSLHIPFIESLLNKMEQIDGEIHTICPIT